MYSTLKALVAVFLLVSSAAGQATNLPQCAQGCANDAAVKVNCNLSDTVCLCKTSFASTVLQCAGTTSCSASDQTQVSNILVAMCAFVSSSASGSSASVSVSVSRSVSVSLSVSVISGSSTPSTPSTSPTLTQTTITSTVTSVSPPRTTTFTTSVPVNSNTIVPPPISLSSSGSGLSSVPPPSVTFPTIPTTASSVPSTSPSAGAAQGMIEKARVAGVAGALFGVGVWLL